MRVYIAGGCNTVGPALLSLSGLGRAGPSRGTADQAGAAAHNNKTGDNTQRQTDLS